MAFKYVQTYVSRYVLIGMFMFIVNPPSHCIIVLDAPCAPHFWSAMFLPCPTTYDTSATFLEKLPFVFIENYLIAVVFYQWTFMWIMVFLGLAWLKMELTKMKYDTNIEMAICELSNQVYFQVLRPRGRQY